MKKKNKLRSILSYRPVENREVILASEAVEYVKKQGYVVHAKHYLFIILAILILASVAVSPIASALDKTYIASENSITLKNAGNNVAYYTLTESKDSVIDAYATGTVTLYESGKIFDSINFIGTSKSVPYEIYLLVEEQIVSIVPVFGQICIQNIGNKSSLECTSQKIKDDSISKTIVKEVKYNGEILSSGTYKWKIKAKKPVNSQIDWVARIGEIDFNEWAWWNTTFQKAREVNITGGNSTMANFSVYLNVSYDSDMQVDFDDVRFVNGACAGAQTQELSYEIDYKINSNYAGFWIKIPSLAVGVNQICMYYSNPDVTTTSSGINAFDDYYKIILHMSEDSGSFLKNSKDENSTFMALHVDARFWKPGIFGRAINMSAGYATANSSILLGSNWTTELWVFALANIGDDATHFSKITGAGSSNFGMFTSQGGTDQWEGCGNFNDAWNSAKAWNDIRNQWYIGQCFSLRGVAGSTSVFQNKTSFTTDTGGGSGGNAYEGLWGLGYYDGSTRFGIAHYDEVRFSNISRSSSWLNRSADNNNMSLFNIGSELTAPTVAFTSVTLLVPITGTNFAGNEYNQSSVLFTSRGIVQNGTVTNGTLYLYLANGTVINIFNSTITANVTQFTYLFVGNGTHKFNVLMCGTGDTVSCNFASANNTFAVLNFVPPSDILRMDFTVSYQLWIWIIIFLIGTVLLFLGIYAGGIIIIIDGFILLHSTNLYIVSGIVIALGALSMFYTKGVG